MFIPGFPDPLDAQFEKLRHLQPSDSMNSPDSPPRQSGVLSTSFFLISSSILQVALPCFMSWPVMVRYWVTSPVVLIFTGSSMTLYSVLFETHRVGFWYITSFRISPTSLPTLSPSLLQDHLFLLNSSVLCSSGFCPKVTSLIPKASVSIYIEHSGLCLFNTSLLTFSTRISLSWRNTLVCYYRADLAPHIATGLDS